MISELTGPASTRAPALEPTLGEPCVRVRRRAARACTPSHRVVRAGAEPVRLTTQVEPMRAFSETALRFVLEVVDKRRPVQHLRKFLTPGVLDQVRGMVGRSSHLTGRRAATLGRIHLRPLNASTAEVFGTYCRGARVHAVAARVSAGIDGALHLTALVTGE